MKDNVKDKGDISSRELGKIGGNIGGQKTKNLVEIGEKILTGKMDIENDGH